MVAASRHQPRAALALLAVAAIWAVAWIAIAHAPSHATVAIAAAFDFVGTAGLALYVVAVRRGHLPRWLLGATIAIGLVFAKVALGTAPDATGALAAAGIALELAVVGSLVLRGRRARAAWRVAREDGAAGIDALTAAFVAARLPARIAGVVATEVALLALVVVGWRAPAPSPIRFTVARANGWSLFAGVLVFLVLVESLLAHVLLAMYVAPTVAWVMTALSLYSALWLVGDALALRRGGVEVRPDAVELRIGARWRGRIGRHAIVAARRVGAAPAEAADVSILGANVVVELAAPVTLHGLFGRTRTATCIALSIDEPDRFVAALAAVTATTQS